MQRNNGWTDGYDSKKKASFFVVEGCINLKEAKAEINSLNVTCKIMKYFKYKREINIEVMFRKSKINYMIFK